MTEHLISERGRWSNLAAVSILDDASKHIHYSRRKLGFRFGAAINEGARARLS